jgi:hypothetical protein
LTAWLFGKYSLKGKLQVEALLHYVIDEPPENADNKQAFKFPFIACEIFTCEIDVILKTLVEDEEVVYFEFTKVNLKLQAWRFFNTYEYMFQCSEVQKIQAICPGELD